MGIARPGYRVRRRKGRPGFLAEVWTGQRYITRSHASHAVALAWAQHQRALVVAGDDISKPTHQSDLLGTRGLGGKYISYLKDIGRGQSHLEIVKTIIDSLAQAVPDLRAPDVGFAVEAWLRGLRLKRRPAEPLAPATRNKWLIMTRGLIRYAMRRDLLDKDPTRAIDYVSLPDYLAPQFTIEELRACLRQTHFKTWRNMRKGDAPKPDPYHRLFAVMMYSGLRFQEASFLRWQDIDFPGELITVSLDSGAAVKRNRERMVPLQAELCDILTPARRAKGPLFSGRSWNPARGFQAFLKRAGVEVKGRTPHSCRHTYAGIMTATGVPGPLLGFYLGHSNAQTTMGYTKLAGKHVAAVKGWPRGEIRIAGEARN